MAKHVTGGIQRHTTKKTTSIGNGIHSRSSKNKSSTRKKYRGQGKSR